MLFTTIFTAALASVALAAPAPVADVEVAEAHAELVERQFSSCATGVSPSPSQQSLHITDTCFDSARSTSSPLVEVVSGAGHLELIRRRSLT